jgi:hypothetical protein
MALQRPLYYAPVFKPVANALQRSVEMVPQHRATGAIIPRPTAPTSPSGLNTIQMAQLVSYSQSSKARYARQERRAGNFGGRNLATVKYRVNGGPPQYKTLPSNGRHSEKVLYDWLQANHGTTWEVSWLYTELAPCGSDYHNCDAKVANWFPNADVYYSIDYPSADGVSSGSETDDDARELGKRKKATRRRSRGSGLLKRLKRSLNNVNSGDEMEPSDFPTGIRSLYSPNRNDSDEDQGYLL